MGSMQNRRRWRGGGAAGWLWLLALVLALAIALFAVKGCGDAKHEKGNAVGTTAPASGPGATGPVNGSAETSGTTVQAGAPATGTTGGGGSGATAAGGGSGSSALTIGGKPADLSSGSSASLRTQVGQAVRADGVKVLSVVGDEVFWVGSGGQQRVLVHLATTGESAPKVRAGDRASFTGTLRANAAGAAGAYGVTKAEDSTLLEQQGVHVEAKVGTLKLSK